MNENTIFQNPAKPGQNQVRLGQNRFEPNQNQAGQGFVSTNINQGIGTQQGPVGKSPGQIKPPPQGGLSFVFHSSRSPLTPKNAIKALIGIVVLIIFGYTVLNFVVPYFRRATESEITLTYWGLWEEPAVMQAIIGEFNKEYPDIAVNYSKQDHKQYRERLVTRIQNGTGPDIFRFHNTWVAMLSGVLLPLPNDTITKAEFAELFYPVANKDLIQNGAIYGIPLEMDTLALYINKDIFDSAGISPPQDWVDFINAARSLTVKDGSGQILTAGAAFGTFDNITHAPDIISMLFIQNGVDLNNIEEDREEAAEALDFYTSFVKEEGSSTWNRNLDQSFVAFANGELAMYFGFSWDYFTIKAINPDLNFEIHPVPQLPNQNTTIASYWAEGVSAKSKYQKEALIFLNFLAKKETAQRFFSESSKTRAFGEPYARIDLADTLKENIAVYPFVLQGGYAESSFFASDTHDNGLNSQMNTYLGDAVNFILGSGSPQSAVETLIEGINQVLTQYSPVSEPE